MPAGTVLGANIEGVDLRTITPDDFAIIYGAWLAHSVLLFRRQNLTDEDLIAFSRRFRELEWAPIQD